MLTHFVKLTRVNKHTCLHWGLSTLSQVREHRDLIMNVLHLYPAPHKHTPTHPHTHTHTHTHTHRGGPWHRQVSVTSTVAGYVILQFAPLTRRLNVHTPPHRI